MIVLLVTFAAVTNSHAQIVALGASSTAGLRGHGRLTDLRDDEGVPLICPTCQIVFSEHPCRRLRATLHGVVFDIFGWEPRRPGGSLCFRLAFLAFRA
jgi:hypothetical protein